MQTTPTTFPFVLADIDYWIIRKLDGTTVKFIYDPPGRSTNVAKLPHTTTGNVTPVIGKTSSSAWCDHSPTQPSPVYQTPNVGLWIADAAGVRKHKNEFDLVIDCGDVMLERYMSPKVFSGDTAIVAGLSKFIRNTERAPKILKIDWADRQAPPLDPMFFMELSKRLVGRVVINCQGGHGRSGSALVALMMAYTGYTPLEGIMHLRAMHCPRAIESLIQHKYLNEVAEAFGVEPNALEAEKVKDFRTAFLAMTHASAKPYQAMLLDNKKVLDEVKRCEVGALDMWEY